MGEGKHRPKACASCSGRRQGPYGGLWFYSATAWRLIGNARLHWDVAVLMTMVGEGGPRLVVYGGGGRARNWRSWRANGRSTGGNRDSPRQHTGSTGMDASTAASSPLLAALLAPSGGQNKAAAAVTLMRAQVGASGREWARVGSSGSGSVGHDVRVRARRVGDERAPSMQAERHGDDASFMHMAWPG